MANITVLENATLTTSTGQALVFTPTDSSARTRLSVTGQYYSQIGVNVEGQQFEVSFARAKGKFQTSGALSTMPKLGKGESLIVEITNHQGSKIDVQWW